MSPIIPVIISLVSLFFGAWIYLKPLQIFDIQRRFYAWINWKIEPISLSKEILNTKLMGLFLMVFVVAVWIYLLFR